MNRLTQLAHNTPNREPVRRLVDLVVFNKSMFLLPGLREIYVSNADEAYKVRLVFLIYFSQTWSVSISVQLACEQALVKDGAKRKREKRGEEREEAVLQPPPHFPLSQFLLIPSSHGLQAGAC